jgi:hypothetical protein
VRRLQLFLDEKRKLSYKYFDDHNLSRARSATWRRNKRLWLFETVAHNRRRELEVEEISFVSIARNPLKSPDPEK